MFNDILMYMIGIFDSGLGGLTVLKAIKEKLPQYDYLYFGDTMHVPYGNRSRESVYILTKNACDFLFNQGCKLIIIACNTATALALKKLQSEYLIERQARLTGQVKQQVDLTIKTGLSYSPKLSRLVNSENIFGVVHPVAEYFAKKGGEKIGVIGTRGTIDSNIYKDEIYALNSDVKIFQKATPLLVPLIEENYFKKSVIKKILRDYLNVLKLKHLNSLILGCTHYPILIKQIKQVMGKKCFVPDPAQIVAESLVDYLTRHPEIENNLNRSGKTRYVVTDLNNNYKQVASLFLKEKFQIEKI